MSKKLVLLAIVAVTAFVVGYGTTAKAWHSNWYGYFYETYDTSGLDVWPPWGGRAGCQGDGNALPAWVNSGSEFINFTICKLGGSTQERRGAAFIISTMAGTPRYVNPGSAEINEFAARVYYASSQGWINWGASVGCTLPNTYYQDSGSGDVAKYSGCGSGGGSAVTFYNGGSYYIVKRFCANPVGSMPVLHDDLVFDIDGDTDVNDSTVLPGQTIQFTHQLYADYNTSPVTINWTTQNMPSGSTVASGNTGTIAGGGFDAVGTENYTVPANAAPGSQICRRVAFNPENQGGGSDVSSTVCATVQYSYSLTPSVGASITGVSGPVTGNIAEPGDSVTFTYAVNNSGLTSSQTVSCIYRQATHTGYSTADPTTAFTPSGANCAPSRTFPVGNTAVATQTIASLPANRSVCRSLTISPTSYGSGMPASWSRQDIGAVSIAGSTSVSGGTFTVESNGADIWGAADQFHYAYRSLSGNGEIIARVVSLGNTDPWAKAGVMIRSSLAADSNHAFMAVTPGNGTAFQRRIAYNTNLSTSGPAVTAPYWVRLVRSGNTFSAYTSSNGTSWTGIASQSISMGSAVYVGLATTSHTSGALTQAVFDNVILNGTPVSLGGNATAEACVHVASKPYARVYGGDISAGGGLVTSPDDPGSCSLNTAAAVIGWNRRSAGAYAGAGVQFAQYALSTIFDSASALGAASGPPATLSFRNSSTSVANGNFGGSFGSVACVQDYYSRRPAVTTSLPASIGAGLATGSYSATGDTQLGGGTINPGTKVDIYIDGDLFIASNITYGGDGSWNSGNVPTLRLVVRGDIFIDNDVTQLDGLYVAQTNAGSGGIIHTCSLAAAPFTPMVLTGTLLTQCDVRLTVNGAFIARQVRLLRTIGTLRQSNAAETSGSANIAEVFNYNPGFWMSQPSDTTGAAEYDAINSLPPVL